MQVKAGIFYRTRGGECVGPMRYDPKEYSAVFPWVCGDPGTNATNAATAWREDGSWALEEGDEDNNDLIAPWHDQTDAITPSPTTITIKSAGVTITVTGSDITIATGE